MKLIDLRKQRFGKLTVVGLTAKRRRGQAVWRCRCDCGGESDVASGDLRNGNSKSCGCYRVEHGRLHGAQIRLRHGEGRNGRESPEYRTWSNMLSRCRNIRHQNYRNYGARGIVVCERWSSFENFLADMGRRPDGCSLDRIDNNGNYEPGNCRWANSKTQSRNQRHNHWVEIRGVRKTLAEWLELTGTLRRTFYTRIAQGRTAEQALFIAPLLNNGRPKNKRKQKRLYALQRHLLPDPP